MSMATASSPAHARWRTALRSVKRPDRKELLPLFILSDDPTSFSGARRRGRRGSLPTFATAIGTAPDSSVDEQAARGVGDLAHVAPARSEAAKAGQRSRFPNQPSGSTCPMDREARDNDLLVLRRIRRSVLRSLKDGDERARLIVLAVDALISERETEPVNNGA